MDDPTLADINLYSEIGYLSARATLEAFSSRSLSPVEHVRAMIARAERLGPIVNAFADTYFEEALASARVAEERYLGRHGGPRLLEGLTVAIKDETAMAGRRSTSGSLLLLDNVCAESAVSVDRMLAAGAIVHARTTTSEFCVAPFTHSRVWGVTRNPWNRELSPGGSSGGAAAALAAGLTALADGSDIGGSIRIPAAFCGLVGYKPPYGRVPLSPPYNLDHYAAHGPLARTVGDAALLTNVISGPHPADPASVPQAVTIPDQHKGIEGWRVGYSLDLGGYPVDSEIRSAVIAAAERLRACGADVDEVTNEELGWDYAETTAAVHAHFGVLFSQEVADAVREQPGQLTAYVPDFFHQLSYIEKRQYFESFEIEGRMHAGLSRVLSGRRLLIAPTTSAKEFVAGEDYVGGGPAIDGDDHRHWLDISPTQAFNVCGRFPVLSVPCGFAQNGLPIGVQFVGRWYDDISVFRAATAFTAVDPWYADESHRPRFQATAE